MNCLFKLISQALPEKPNLHLLINIWHELCFIMFYISLKLMSIAISIKTCSTPLTRFVYELIEGEFKSTADYQYQLLRCNVDLLKIIQLGLTFLDEKGNLPESGPSTWQFNFRSPLSHQQLFFWGGGIG